jgi:adenine-specific DNA-methyltransferase
LYARELNALNVLSQLHTTRPLMNVISEMRAAGESWKYTSIMLERGPRTHFCDIEDGKGNPIQIFKRTLVRRGTVRSVMEQEGLSEADTYAKYFASIFSDTNAQTSIRDRVKEAVGELSPDELLEVQYVPRSGRAKGKRVTHSYISRTVRRVIWLSDSAELVSGEIVKKDRLGTFWDNFDYNNVGKEGGIPYPDGKKPIDLLRTCIQLYQQKEGIFVDFFAGSCSLGHAVLRQNLEDQGKRRFLLVQMREELRTNQTRFQAAVSFYQANGIEPIASEVGKERLRRAGSEIANHSDRTDRHLDLGFRVLKIDSSNMKDVFYAPGEMTQESLEGVVDNIKPDRSGEDLLFQVLLDCGVDLGLPIACETIEHRQVHFVDENVLAACFDRDVTADLVKQIASRQPQRAVFRDHCFNKDSDRINIEQIFKQLSPSTQLKRL